MSMKLKVLGVALLGLVVAGCDQFGDVDPIETACAMCEILDQTGICQMTQSEQKQFAGCTEAQDVAVKFEGEPGGDSGRVTLVCVEPEGDGAP